jgi:nicotinamide-nucleotide amidase
MSMKAALLTIGDELLIGQVLNTNIQWMSQRLVERGIQVTHHLTVGDQESEMIEALTWIQQKAQAGQLDVLIIGGGLGPTHDDLTMEVLSKFFSIPLVHDDEWMSKVEGYFKARNRVMSANNRKQGLLLQTAKRIDNDYGTAAGQHLTVLDSKLNCFVVPGVPHEMKHMMESYILPFLEQKSGTGKLLQKTLVTTGVGESLLATRCDAFVKKVKADPRFSLAFLPSSIQLRLRLSMLTDPNESEFEKWVQELYQLCGDDLIGFDPITLPEWIVNALTLKKQTLAIAESCTGGLISHQITQIPGSSLIFKGSMVTYQTESKINQLNIPQTLIDTHGVVSEAVAIAMAESIKSKWGSDFGIGTTGYMGLSADGDRTKIGEAYLAVACPWGTTAKKFTFENNRDRNKERASQAALDLLRRQMIGKS